MARPDMKNEMEDSPSHEAMPSDVSEDKAEGYMSVGRKSSKKVSKKALMKQMAAKRAAKGSKKRKMKKMPPKKAVKKNQKGKRSRRRSAAQLDAKYRSSFGA